MNNHTIYIPPPNNQNPLSDNSLKNLNEMIDELHRSFGLIMFKGGTEWEDMDIEEIAYLKQIGTSNIPSLMKVGGLESKSEMRHLLDLNVEVLLGPMIETQFALEKFVKNALLISQRKNKTVRLAMMVESITCFNNLDNIMSSPYFESIDFVVLGRLDLANSIGKQDVDNIEVQQLSKKIIKKVTAKGKQISLGGFVNPKSAITIKNDFGVDMLNTIHLLFDLNKSTNISQSVRLGLQFEKAFYQSLCNLFPKRAEFYQTRIQMTEKKLTY